MRETWVCSLGREDPLEKQMATHSSSLASENPMDGGTWQITSPWGLKRVGYNLATKQQQHRGKCIRDSRVMG